MNEHARQQTVFRVREHRTQGYGAGGLVNRYLGEFQFAFLGVDAVVFQGQLDLGRVVTGFLQLAAIRSLRSLSMSADDCTTST